MNFGRKKEQIENCRTRYQRIIISKNDRLVLKRVKNMLAYLRHVVITVWVNTENRGITDEITDRLQSWAYQAHISISP